MPEDENIRSKVLPIALDLYLRTWPMLLNNPCTPGAYALYGNDELERRLTNDCIRAAEAWVKAEQAYRRAHGLG